jgi:diamine N-acetyltransferase
MKNLDRIRIRTAVQDDAQLLADLGAAAFFQAFAKDNSAADMAAYLESAFSYEKQRDEIAEPGSIFVIGEIDGEPAGYARLLGGSSETCITGLNPVELVRIYVLQEWIGAGVGAKLMQNCLELAGSKGYDVIWLGVWKQNGQAVVFYQKWGFEIVGTHNFLLGSDLQQDWIMQRKLESNSNGVGAA